MLWMHVLNICIKLFQLKLKWKKNCKELLRFNSQRSIFITQYIALLEGYLSLLVTQDQDHKER